MADLNLSGFDEEVNLSGFGAGIPEEPGMLTSAALGAAQGVTMGFADEMEAAVRSALAGNLTKEEYDKQIMDIRQRYKRAEEANPISSLAGNIVAGAVLPGFGLGKGAVTLGKAVRAGALTGGITGLGMSEADLAAGEVGKAAEDVLAGTVAGGVTGAVVPFLAERGKAIGKYIAEQPLVGDALEIAKDAAKGVIYSGDDAMNRAAAKLTETSKNVVSSLESQSKMYGELMDSAVKAIDDNAAKTGVKFNVEPVLNEVKKLDTILDKPTQKDIDFITDVINKAAGKGDLETVKRKLTEKVAEAQQAKLLQARTVAQKIDDLYSSGADEEVIGAMESRYNKLLRDIASIQPFEQGVEATTMMPVGSINTDYKAFVKATEGLENFDKMKTPAQLREMHKILNSPYVTQNIDTTKAIQLRQNMRDQLKDMFLSAGEEGQQRAYTEASDKLSNFKKLLEKSKLQDFYSLGEAGKQGSDTRRMFDVVKQYSKRGSKEGAFFRDFISQLSEIEPELAKGIEADVMNASRQFNLTSGLHAQDPFAETGLAFFAPGAKAGMMKASEMVGSGVHKVDKILTGARRLALVLPRKIIDSIDKDNSAVLRQMADKLRGASEAKSVDLYNKINTILTMSPAKQKATIFSLVQQPQYRDMFNFLSDEEK